MPFQPGHKLAKGRPKGSINKNSLNLREVIETTLGKTLSESILDELALLEPNERVRVKLDLMQYCHPKLKAIEITGDENKDQKTSESIEKLTVMFKETFGK